MKNSITETQIDHVSHVVAGVLSGYGVVLSDELKCGLNDTLSTFLSETCDVVVTQCSGVDSGCDVIQLAFDVVEGSVDQQVRILNPEYDEESIIAGLESGKLATTMGHGDGVEYIDVVVSGEHVGLILSQEVNGEYVDFR